MSLKAKGAIETDEIVAGLKGYADGVHCMVHEMDDRMKRQAEEAATIEAGLRNP